MSGVDTPQCPVRQPPCPSGTGWCPATLSMFSGYPADGAWVLDLWNVEWKTVKRISEHDRLGSMK